MVWSTSTSILWTALAFIYSDFTDDIDQLNVNLIRSLAEDSRSLAPSDIYVNTGIDLGFALTD